MHCHPMKGIYDQSYIILYSERMSMTFAKMILLSHLLHGKVTVITLFNHINKIAWLFIFSEAISLHLQVRD